MRLTAEQYRAIRRSTLKLLHRVLRGGEVSLLRVEGEGGEVKFVVLAASGDLADAVARGVTEVMGNPPVSEQWEVPG